MLAARDSCQVSRTIDIYFVTKNLRRQCGGERGGGLRMCHTQFPYLSLPGQCIYPGGGRGEGEGEGGGREGLLSTDWEEKENVLRRNSCRHLENNTVCKGTVSGEKRQKFSLNI
jgi:hypothetical protein